MREEPLARQTPAAAPKQTPWAMRLGNDVAGGLITGFALAWLSFGLAWLSEGWNEASGAHARSGSNFALLLSVLMIVARASHDSAETKRGQGKPWRGFLLCAVSFAVWAAIGAILLYGVARSLQATVMAENRELATLATLGVALPLIGLANLSRRIISERRPILFIAAAGGLWVASEWFVKLGPAATDQWHDPRQTIALWAVIGTGALLFFAVLKFMDWRIDRLASQEDKAH